MEREIRFTEKKVDTAWKEQIAREKKPFSPTPASSPKGREAPPSTKAPGTSPIFLNFLSSLSYQVMMHLGEIPHPETGKPEMNLDAAREIIEILRALHEKCANNLSPEEERFFVTVLPEIQLKFAQLV